MSLHIYSAPGQPATKWVDHNTDPPIEGGWPAHKRFHCITCGHMREARNLMVQLYYDATYFHCREGHEHPGGDRRRRLVPRRPPKNNPQEKP